MFCTECGKKMEEGYKFCPRCGAPAPLLEEEPAMPMPEPKGFYKGYPEETPAVFQGVPEFDQPLEYDLPEAAPDSSVNSAEDAPYYVYRPDQGGVLQREPEPNREIFLENLKEPSDSPWPRQETARRATPGVFLRLLLILLILTAVAAGSVFGYRFVRGNAPFENRDFSALFATAAAEDADILM